MNRQRNRKSNIVKSINQYQAYLAKVIIDMAIKIQNATY